MSIRDERTCSPLLSAANLGELIREWIFAVVVLKIRFSKGGVQLYSLFGSLRCVGITRDGSLGIM